MGDSFWARLADRASGGFEHDVPPPPADRKGRGHRLVVAVIIIAMSSSLIAVAAIPAAALLGRFVGTISDRLAAVGPNGKIVVPPIGQRSVILDRNGQMIATLAGAENRIIVPLDQIAPIARQAVIAIEDARFYQHNGVDRSGILRALFANATAGRVLQGGSTITQQLVKNVLVGNERTLDRKIKEAQYAIALEREPGMTKERILEMYLNETYFGGGVYGMEAAAEYYFGEKALMLTAPQAAMLAGMIAAPERFNPITNARETLDRRNTVLQRMADQGYISRDDANKFSNWPLGAGHHPLPPIKEPYFVDFIKRQILDDPRFGRTETDRANALFQGGLRIETTLDLKLNAAAEDAIDQVLNLKGDPAAALVSIEPSTGRVRAMVGGKNFKSQQYNLATGDNRQAGSTFKPFTLVTALNQGISPGLTLDTPSPLHLKDALGHPWNPENYSHHGEGLMNMRKATENSVNTYFIQLVQMVGPANVVATAHAMGIQSPLQPVPSLVLGTMGVSPYEMASAYGTLANNGIYCKPFTISRVLAADGKEIMRNDPQCTRVIDATIAAEADDILQGVILRGTGKTNGNIGRPACGKTGTTDDYTDAWFMGFTPQFSTGVWLGYPESTKHKLHNIHGYPDVFGGSLPAMIWNRFMTAAHKGLPVIPFPPPPAPIYSSVPNVVGELRDQALAQLKASGFEVKTIYVASQTPAGTILSESPSPGTQVEKGTLVELRASDGSLAQPAPSPS
ncbi:MAG: penicillin-binding protein [Actinomycetota bacterium]